MSSTSSRNKKHLDSDQEEKQKKDLEYKPEEIELYDEITTDLGFDNENQSDLEVLEVPKELTDEEKIDLMKDPKTKTLLRDEGDNPTMMDSLDDDDEIPELTNKRIKEMKEEAVDAKNNLIVWLGSQEKIKLHISKGMVDGKKLWVEKSFWFNNLDKMQEIKLSMLRTRQTTLNYKNNVISNKQTRDLTEEEIEWLYKAPIMIDVAGLRISAFEANCRFGMSYADFVHCDVDEYAVALAAYAWRSINLPYYKQKQSSSGSNKQSGKIST